MADKIIIPQDDPMTIITGGDPIVLVLPESLQGIQGLPGDVSEWLAALSEYSNDESAVSDGLSTGDWYITDSNSDVLPAGVLKRVTI